MTEQLYYEDVEEGAEIAASLEEVSEALKLIMSSFPDFAEFEDKVLVSITDESGNTVEPDGLMQIFGDFAIKKVSIE